MAIKFDDLMHKVDERFAPLEVELEGEVVRFENITRLSKERRAKLAALEEKLSTALNEAGEKAKAAVEAGEEVQEDEGADARNLETVREILTTLCKDKAAATRLLKRIGDDFVATYSVYLSYWEETQAGEASGSQEK